MRKIHCILSNKSAISSLSSPNYRPDVDGLRAIAILAVIGFHVSPMYFPGGFVGVDVFFVISGYLISTIIIDSLQQARFSLCEFYFRRIKRIFPALSLVLGATLIFGFLLLMPDELSNLGKSVAAGAAFLSNLVLWQEANYFDSSAELKPLLHIWSLGIEEQFYLIYPWMVLLIWKFRPYLVYLLGAVAVLSFALNLLFVSAHPVATFYLPPTRFWELMFGCILAYTQQTEGTRPLLFLTKEKINRFSNIQPVVGLFLLLAGVVFLNKEVTYPGILALIPIIGTVLLISANPKSWINRAVIGHPTAVFIGRISYPLYLWHWPLLSFARTLNSGDPSPQQKIGIVATSFMLAWATYRFVEQPIRVGKTIRSKRTISVILMSTMALIAIGGLVTYKANGFPSRFAPIFHKLQNYNYVLAQSRWRAGECFLNPDQSKESFSTACIDKSESIEKLPLVVLWGDSYAAALYPGLKDQQRSHKFRIAQYTASACPPILDLEIPSRPFCREINEEIAQKIKRLRPNTVLLEGAWLINDYWKIDNTLNQLKKLGIENIVLIGPVPSWKGSLPRSLFDFSKGDPHQALPIRMTYGLDVGAKDVDLYFRKKAKYLGIQYVSPMRIFCNVDGCLTRLGDSVEDLTTVDSGHLTYVASQYFWENVPINVFMTKDSIKP